MAVWRGSEQSAPSQSLAPPDLDRKPESKPRPEPKPPARVAPPQLPESSSRAPRSTVREARELIDATARKSVEARVWLMDNAKDEATRLRAAEGLSAAAGLAPQVSQVNVVHTVDLEDALAALERLQVERGEVLEVRSVEVD